MQRIYEIHSYNYNYPPWASVPLPSHIKEKILRDSDVSSVSAVESLHNERQPFESRQWKEQIPNLDQTERMALMKRRRQIMEQETVQHLGQRFDRYI